MFDYQHSGLRAMVFAKKRLSKSQYLRLKSLLAKYGNSEDTLDVYEGLV